MDSLTGRLGHISHLESNFLINMIVLEYGHLFTDQSPAKSTAESIAFTIKESFFKL